MAAILYKRQKEILVFLNKFIGRYGHAPSLTEIANKIGVKSLATVHEHLTALEKKGLIKKTSGVVRSIELIDKRISNVVKGLELPISGFIAAGSPIYFFSKQKTAYEVDG